MRTRPVLIAVAVATSLLALSGCKEHAQPMQPQSIEDLFARWFVNPSESRLDSLVGLDLSCSQIDEVASRIRSGSGTYQTGATSLTLLDTAGAPYTLGYKTPKTIDPARLYPLIVYLHGGIGTTLTTKGDSAWNMFAPLADSMDLFLASPSGNRTTPWWSPAGLSRITQTVRYFSLHYPIDPDKVFLAGVSDGATGSFAVANTIPHAFAGFFAISGLGAMLEQYGLELVPGNLMQRPFYVVNGGKDHLYPVKYVKAFLDSLENRGVTIKRKIYPNEKHGFDYRAKEMGAIAGFMRSWSRPHDRGGLNWTFTAGYPCAADNIIAAGFSEQSLTTPYVLGSWKGDTLALKSAGLAWFVFAPPGDHGASINVQLNGNPTLRIAALDTDRRTMFRALLHNDFPTSGCRHFYRISMQE